jgi:SAM-dependent methyltransferase
LKLCLACQARFEGAAWRCPACNRTPELRDGIPVLAPALAAGDGHDADYRYADIFAAEAQHFWFRSRTRLLLWALARYFPGASSLMDLGCGTGFVLQGISHAVPALALTGADSQLRGLEFARERLPGVCLLQLDSLAIPFEDEFDVVAACDVLEHLDQDQEVLARMRRAVRPGGGVLLTVPQHPFLWSALDDFSRHRRRYTRSELIGKVEAAGLQVVRTTSFVSLLLPSLLLARRLGPRSADRLDPLAEYRLSPLLNATLLRVLDLERALIRMGLSFPAGGSLLLAARRRA